MGFAFTYSGDPARNDRDAVRFFVGDVNEDRPLLCDSEVDFTLAEFSNHRLAAATCADALGAKFARESNQRVGDISKSLSDVSKAFTALAMRLRKEAGKRAGASFPATSIAWKKTRGEDTDLVQPEFVVGLGDDPSVRQINDSLNRIDWRGW